MADMQTRLGLQWPIIQAPMAGVSTPQLAAAVSNAGGLGAYRTLESSAANAPQRPIFYRLLAP